MKFSPFIILILEKLFETSLFNLKEEIFFSFHYCSFIISLYRIIREIIKIFEYDKYTINNKDVNITFNNWILIYCSSNFYEKKYKFFLSNYKMSKIQKFFPSFSFQFKIP